MRIVGGEWRGRTLAGPPGRDTRPTADRVRQALFDMLLHAPWGGRERVEGVRVLDGFAGTGALGLEALSRGAAHATFVESDRAALTVLRRNISLCGAPARSTVLAADLLSIGPGRGCSLLFLDPPYGQGLVPPAVGRLRQMGWVASGALIAAETGQEDRLHADELLAERSHGAAKLTIWREP